MYNQSALTQSLARHPLYMPSVCWIYLYSSVPLSATTLPPPCQSPHIQPSWAMTTLVQMVKSTDCVRLLCCWWFYCSLADCGCVISRSTRGHDPSIPRAMQHSMFTDMPRNAENSINQLCNIFLDKTTYINTWEAWPLWSGTNGLNAWLLNVAMRIVTGCCAIL